MGSCMMRDYYYENNNCATCQMCYGCCQNCSSQYYGEQEILANWNVVKAQYTWFEKVFSKEFHF